MFIRIWALFGVAAFCLAQDSPDSPQIRRELSLGVQAYRQGHFDEAGRYFERAIAINPQAVNPHLYLGMACAAQWNPESLAPANLELVRRAESEFLKVLEVEPEQINALQSIANLSYQRAMALTEPSDRWEQFTRAAGWYEHLGEVSPRHKSAFYMGGMIAWNKCQPEIDAARRQAGMKADSAEPITNPSIRKTVRDKCGSVIDEGIEQLKKGLEADRDYSEAMSYLSILERQRANLEDSPEAAERDIKEADAWAQKSAEAARRRASKPQQDEDQ